MRDKVEYIGLGFLMATIVMIGIYKCNKPEICMERYEDGVVTIECYDPASDSIGMYDFRIDQ